MRSYTVFIRRYCCVICTLSLHCSASRILHYLYRIVKREWFRERRRRQPGCKLRDYICSVSDLPFLVATMMTAMMILIIRLFCQKKQIAFKRLFLFVTINIFAFSSPSILRTSGPPHAATNHYLKAKDSHLKAQIRYKDTQIHWTTVR